MYSQDQSPDDLWLSRQKKGRMWDESKITPYPIIPLDSMRGRSGQEMTVCEPCNTLSNWAFHEASVWISCTGLPINRDEYASLIASFDALAVGGEFLHACACEAGNLVDRFTISWLMMQAYQLMVKNSLEIA